ncbi:MULTISPECIES: SCO family protein [Aequorivita]|uniref:SCO family protein n=1 Tax=Aequorivita iocasae TaxID=2803865 RepID=A0ABX7DRQ2_9FLAO|nr:MULTISPECIES: SCO family protein [Aequorivita]QQX75834.1 SCO family protein [Aequorivita iocasae]UCA55294.1 SCO family protein [Aequorivita sp. F7]
MKKFRYLVIAFALGSFFSCNSNSEKNTDTSDSAKVKKAVSEAIPEMSIYNLPSHWTTQNGEEIELKDLEGKVVVMVMIYTTCKAACPRLVADMRNIEKQVPEEKKDDVQYVFVSIDPETDTPERLKAFSKENEMEDDKWLFLRGTEADTREFAAVLAVNYKEISPMDFSHSNIISVFDHHGEMVHQQEGLGVDNKETVQAIIELAK